MKLVEETMATTENEGHGMRLSQLLNGLNPYSQVTPRMLAELTAWHEKLIRRSRTNDNWTERTQKEFELVHAIVRRNAEAISIQ